MGNTTMAVGPVAEVERQLYASPGEARSALISKLKDLRERHSSDADEINAVLDELDAVDSGRASDRVEAPRTGYVQYFSIAGQQWTAYYFDLEE